MKIAGLISCIIIMLITSSGYSQTLKTSNIHHTEIDGKLVIFFDLPANRDSLKIDIVFHKKSDAKFKYVPNPKFIKGDIGIGKYSGANKKITWDRTKEPDYLFTGSGFYFDVIATKVSKRNSLKMSVISDIDGNSYNTVTIGKQTWMKENLKVTRYRNGDSIPNITYGSEWMYLTNGAFCNFDNDENNIKIYGRLYNWYAVTDSRNTCPSGWHIPGKEDWDTLITYLGGDSIAGIKMKEAGTAHWNLPGDREKGDSLRGESDNSSGFNALPCGRREYYGKFEGLGIGCRWWSLTESNNGSAWDINIQENINEGRITLETDDKRIGCSVRCLKD